MPKPLLGLLLGALLGLIDGASAWFYPDVRPQIQLIMLLSTLKGLLTGLAAGYIARRWRSLPLGIGVGLAVGLVLSYLAASEPTNGRYYYLEIMLPGAALGAIVGFATQRYGATPATP